MEPGPAQLRRWRELEARAGRFPITLGLVLLVLSVVIGVWLTQRDGSSDSSTGAEVPDKPLGSKPGTQESGTTPGNQIDTTPAAVPCGHRHAGNSASAAPYEPNNNIAEAFGPLKANKRYHAVIEGDDDQDWFVFCTAEEAPVTLRVTLVDDNAECLGFEATVTDGNGVPINDDRPSLYSFDTVQQPTQSFTFNASADHRYYLEFDPAQFECSGGIYEFSLTGPLTDHVASAAGIAQ